MLVRMRHRIWNTSQLRFLASGRVNRHLIRSRREINEEELLRIAGGNQELVDKFLDYEPVENEAEIDPDDVPFKPGFLLPLPPRGTRNSRLHRKTDVLRRERVRPVSRRVRKTWNGHLRTKDDFKPVPWNYQPDLKPKQPFIYFPPQPEVYTEMRSFQWTRQNYLPEIGYIYPDPRVQVEVTITNDPVSVEHWAQERITERNTIYGLETKWWMKEKDGLYVSDSSPKEWSDLALLQLSTERDILLIQVLFQPLDMPVEKLGPRIRQILKYKFIKKTGFDLKSKSAALKMCELPIHGCHEVPRLLQLQLGMPSIEDLPEDILAQNLPSVSQFLLGLDLKSKDRCKAHWEAEYLQDDLIELAAMEAWCCWALYGIITRINKQLLAHWESHLPDEFRRHSLKAEDSVLKSLREEHGTLISHVAMAEERLKSNRTPNWKAAKESAVALAHEVGLDLKSKVDEEIMQD